MQSTIKQTLWGTSERLCLSCVLQIELIRGGKGGRSSLHRHHRKTNKFLVLQGTLRLHIETGCEPQVIDLTPCGVCSEITIPAGVLHRMEFIEDAVAIEVYEWTGAAPLDPDDIERPNGQDGRAPAAEAEAGDEFEPGVIVIPASMENLAAGDPFDPRRRVRIFQVDLKYMYLFSRAAITIGIRRLFPGASVSVLGERRRDRCCDFEVHHESFDPIMPHADPPRFRLVPSDGQTPSKLEPVTTRPLGLI